MSIKLTKTIDGKEVELDLISLKGKTYVRPESWEEAQKKGVTKKALKEAGIEVLKSEE